MSVRKAAYCHLCSLSRETQCCQQQLFAFIVMYSQADVFQKRPSTFASENIKSAEAAAYYPWLDKHGVYDRAHGRKYFKRLLAGYAYGPTE